ncbi:inositol 2-dehydrogenase [Rhizobium redzepovicii]|uniref:inositol 2-dehydrogenase n=1 Tax=Rhizobium redzepovicii TaxID=2867518 RepID=UPI001C92F752|nr:inositol 2-dehydrogenase [Rhizobium redzepovicii]MBY4592608.1 inositol 2-dehydrogenase [Rhizobium redzepovicii]MBY4615398.1 inositol 2-dehydrogenase [Rhizobium redzepovicii]
MTLRVTHTKPSQLRVALFGAGRMGEIHSATLTRHAGAHLVGIVDAHRPSAERLAGEHGVRVLEEDSVFDDNDIDAVIIASAADSHPHLILRSATAGKAIFCEKPLARDLEAVLSVAKVVEATKVPFLLAFNRRFDPDFSALARRLHGGEVGAVELAIITSRDPAPPPIDYVMKSGGLFRETTIHDIDVARWLTGEDPVSVHATASALTTVGMRDAQLPDTAVLTLKMPSGAIVSINNSWRAAYGYDQRVEVLGQDGMLKLANRRQDGVTRMGTSGTLNSNPEPFFLERYAAAYIVELDHFVTAVREGQTISPGVADGVKALRIAYAAEESARTGQTVTLG